MKQPAQLAPHSFVPLKDARFTRSNSLCLASTFGHPRSPLGTAPNPLSLEDPLQLCTRFGKDVGTSEARGSSPPGSVLVHVQALLICFPCSLPILPVVGSSRLKPTPPHLGEISSPPWRNDHDHRLDLLLGGCMPPTYLPCGHSQSVARCGHPKQKTF